jgi:hypothetical protein
MVLCTGNNSHALYAVNYVIRNVEELYENMRKEEEKLKVREKAREELEGIKEYNKQSDMIHNININDNEEDEGEQ